MPLTTKNSLFEGPILSLAAGVGIMAPFETHKICERIYISKPAKFIWLPKERQSELHVMNSDEEEHRLILL